MSERLDEARANIVRNAILGDSYSPGSASWCEDHHVTRDEFESLLEYGVRLATMYDYRDANGGMPALVETKATFKPGALKRDLVVLKVEMPPSKVAQVQTLIDEPVHLMIYPEQMPLPLDDGMVVVDGTTGEVVNG